MHETYTSIGNYSFDCWSLSHLLMYIILGFAFPHQWKLILVVGILWEIFEFFGSRIEKILYPKKKLYWCAKFSDLIVNTVGFILGLCIRLVIAYLIYLYTKYYR